MHFGVGPLVVGRPRIGLALGSGAARGWAHIGVIEALEKAGIQIDVVTGTSAGAVIGAFYAAGALKGLRTFAESHRSIRQTFAYLDVVIARRGLVGGERFVEYLVENLPARKFEDLRCPLGVVATDLVTLGEVHISSGALLPAIRASVSVPGFLSPQENGQRQLVDGGLLNPVPVNLARKLGADIVIAVDLNGHPTEKRAGSLTEVISRSVLAMQQRIRLAQRQEHPPDVLIEPVLSGIRFMDYHRTEEAIAEGARAAQRKMDEILSARYRMINAAGRWMVNPLAFRGWRSGSAGKPAVRR